MVKNFLKIINWCSSWYLKQVNDYIESLRDFISWPKRYYYGENLQKFISGELNSSDFVNQLPYPILSDKREAKDLETSCYQQAEIEVDPKWFGISSFFWKVLIRQTRMILSSLKKT